MLPSPHITLSVVVVKASPKTEPQASVLWRKHDSFEHILGNGKAFEDAMLPAASGGDTQKATVSHFTFSILPGVSRE